MALIANTAFELKVTNSARNNTQNVAGKFGTNTGSSFTPDVCSAGFLCVQNGLIPCEGYGETLNGNTWYFNAATSGTVGSVGDHTGIYACNTYDVNKVGSGDLMYNLGANTLGLSLPSGVIGDFTELIVGEQIKVGVGNLTAAPSSGQIYATIANGLWTPTNTAPTGSLTVYGAIVRTEAFNEGASYWGQGYVIKIMRSPVAASE